MTVRKRILAALLLAGVMAVSSALAGKGTWFALTTTTRSRP
jgi:hypothetical protein